MLRMSYADSAAVDTIYARMARLANASECEWYFGCHNEPTHLQDHPAFPNGVPTCETCRLFIEDNR